MAGGSDGQQRFSAKKDAYTDRSGDVVFPAHAGMIPPSHLGVGGCPVFPAHAGMIPRAAKSPP